MTKDEALKLALDELIHASSYCNTYDAIDAIKEALAQPEQEPVAIYRAGQAKGEAFHVEFLKVMDADEVLLYAAPPAAQPVQEPNQASYPEYDRGFSEGWDRCKAAAQRPWVGLTDDEIADAVRPLYGTNESAFMGLTDDIPTARAIEDKLRELNT
jgi:hypothetical protein